MPTTSKDQAIRLIETMGLARPRELEAQGISRVQLARLVNEGLVIRQARGIYVVPRHAPTETHTLAQVADLLITKYGTLGRVAVAGRERICINQSVALLRFDPAVDVGFMQHTLRAAPYQERMTFEAGGTAIKHIEISRLGRMAIALPAKEEQRAVTTFLDRETAKIDALVAKVHDAIELLKELHTALISAAVTG